MWGELNEQYFLRRLSEAIEKFIDSVFQKLNGGDVLTPPPPSSQAPWEWR